VGFPFHPSSPRERKRMSAPLFLFSFQSSLFLREFRVPGIKRPSSHSKEFPSFCFIRKGPTLTESPLVFPCHIFCHNIPFTLPSSIHFHDKRKPSRTDLFFIARLRRLLFRTVASNFWTQTTLSLIPLPLPLYSPPSII